MRYLSAEDILEIHSLLIDETGGSHGVRDLGLVQSAASSPLQVVYGKELYVTVYQKAAVYARIITQHHPFLDGNRRTGITAALVFLEDNGFAAKIESGEIEACALSIAAKKFDIEEIAKWLESHTI